MPVLDSAYVFDRSMPQPSKIARAILEGFDHHYRLFRYVAQQAKGRFENGDWHGMRDSARERIDFYDERVREATERIERDFDLVSLTDDERDLLWQAVKMHYVALLAEHRQPECAETFFNSVCTKLLHRDYFKNSFIFVRPGVATDYMDSDPPSYRAYYPVAQGLRNALRQILIDFGLACPWVDVERDIRLAIRAICKAHDRGTAFARPFKVEPDCQIQVLSNLFFRNKGAYVVGRVINGTRITPLAVPILRDDKGRLYLDTVLIEFGSHRARCSRSRAPTSWSTWKPRGRSSTSCARRCRTSRPSELYTMLGLQKQGKTLFYRDFLHHLRHSTDQFVVAPGIKGLVMTVFTLPSFPYVFKLIKDVIPHPKETDRAQIEAEYRAREDARPRRAHGRHLGVLAGGASARPFLPELLASCRRLRRQPIEVDGDRGDRSATSTSSGA